MSILTAIRDYWLAEPRAQKAMLLRSAPPMYPQYQIGKPQYPSRSLETYDQQAYRKSALIFRCVQYVANAAGAAPVRLDRMVDGEPVQDTDNDLAKLLKQPNVGMGESRFISFIALNMLVAGFIVVEKERDALGRVIRLWPLRTDWLKWIPRNDGMVDWEYRRPGSYESRILLAEDVIPATYADVPNGTPTGIGPLEVMLREIGISSGLTDFLKTFLDRGALPLYALIPSDDAQVARQWMDPAMQEAVRQAWRDRYQGVRNAVDPLPLAGVKDVRPIGMNFNELAYPDLNNLTDARICMGFGVSPILIDAQVGLQQSTYSNKTEARRSFYEDTMTYLWSRLDDAFTRHLLPEFVTDPTYNLSFDTSDIPALKDDRDKRMVTATTALRAGGLTINSFLGEVGMKAVEGGDVFLIPSGVNPVREEELKELGKVADEQESADATAESTDAETDPDAENDAASADETKGAGDAPEARTVPPLGAILITESDVDKAVDWFDGEFPELAGLLDAEVVEEEGED